VKTKDRILKSALTLFNEEGEPAVSTVDIANDVGISPGNLYYHFRGKEALIEALFASFEEEMRTVLKAPVKKPLSVEDNWLYLYVVFEEIYDFRFFYRNMNDILARFPALARRFQALLDLKENAATAMIRALETREFIALGDTEAEHLARRMALILTHWLNDCALRNKNAAAPGIIHEGVREILLEISAYIPAGRAVFIDLVETFYAESTLQRGLSSRR